MLTGARRFKLWPKVQRLYPILLGGLVRELMTEVTIGNIYIHLFQVEWFHVHPARWRLLNYCDSFWRFYLHDQDGALYEFEGKEYALEAGQLYLIPSGVRFSTRSERELQQFYIHFDVLGLPEVMMRELFASPVRLPSSRELQGAARRILGSGGNPGQSSGLFLHLEIKSFLYQALCKYLESVPASRIARCQEMSASLEPVRAALHFIEEHLGGELNNAVLARCCRMGESHFIRTFGAATGRSPAQYVAMQRVKIAAQRLLFSQESIERIAHETGFGNRHYFTRVFTRHVGQSPAAYRKSASAWQVQPAQGR